MKILVIADTHGNVGNILTALDREKPDVLIHLGDGLSDLADIKFTGQIFAVRGNNDTNGKIKTIAKVEYAKKIMLLTHGNEFDVKKNYEKLIQFSYNQGADIVLFGHTHKQDYFTRNGMIFVNPGALKDRETGTYATIEFGEGEPQITHHRIQQI